MGFGTKIPWIGQNWNELVVELDFHVASDPRGDADE